MSHIYRASEWETNNRWYVNDVEETGSLASQWWIPCRILDIPLKDYPLFLNNEFNAKGFCFKFNNDKSLLTFYFETQTEARKYKNYINKIAREKKFYV
jgi:hypothetical protein